MLNPSVPVEEETLRGYRPERFYPVRLGEVFNSRYKTVGKLGYGSASTVWLCRDLDTESGYVALKVYVNSSKVHRELPVYEHINSVRTDHAGRYRIRKLLDSFEVEGPDGDHICLVHNPLGISLDELRKLKSDKLFDTTLVRECLRPILAGLEFLHREARIIHTDLQPSNMLLGIHDTSVFGKFEQISIQDPVPRKELEDRTIYLSQRMPLTNAEASITDFSEARFGDTKHSGRIMPNVYRAPEVILEMPWDFAVDIWGFGITLWDLFQPERLFPAHSEDAAYSECHHLAQMVAVMGPPPHDFITRSVKAQEYWDDNGQWKGKVPVPDMSLASSEQRLEGLEKEQFLAFMRKMLQWRPEDRCACREVYFDEWLLADLIESGEIVVEEE